MHNLNPFASVPQGVSYQTADAGGAGGTQGGGSFQPTGASGGGSQTSQGGSSSQGGSAPVAYSDDMQITRDGKTMTMKEYISSNYVSKADHDNVRNLTRQEIENNLRKLAATIKQPQQQNRQPQQQADPFASFRDMPMVGGNDMVKALEGSLGPVAQSLARMQQKIEQQDQQLRKLGSGVGTLAKERSGQERTTRVQSAIASLGEGYDAKDPFLQEIAQDVLDAWEFEKPEEFPSMVAARIKAAEKFVLAKQKADLDRAKSRRFVRPGGSASPSGGARFDPRNAAKSAADMLFGPRGAGANT